MTNIEKLYELAGVKRIYSEFNNGKETVVENVFSPYRQLELIKWLSKKTYRNYFKLLYSFGQKSWYMESDCISTPNMKSFENTLAGLVCKLWENLSDEQKEEIKRILE